MNNKKYLKTSIVLLLVFAAWLILDKLSKIYFDSGQFYIGQQISDSILGIFHLTLVHNTGAAFGLFGNSTLILGVFSIAVSAVLLLAPIAFMYWGLKNKKDINIPLLSLVCVSLISAGGIGNAIDRLANGYVVDFICFDFIDFPVFNIADIGVTCGAILLIVVLIVYNKKSSNKN